MISVCHVVFTVIAADPDGASHLVLQIVVERSVFFHGGCVVVPVEGLCRSAVVPCDGQQVMVGSGQVEEIVFPKGGFPMR